MNFRFRMHTLRAMRQGQRKQTPERAAARQARDRRTVIRGVVLTALTAAVIYTGALAFSNNSPIVQKTPPPVVTPLLGVKLTPLPMPSILITPSPVPSPTFSPTPSPTPSPSPTPKPTRRPTPKPTATPSATPEPEETPEATPTPTPTPTPIPTPTPFFPDFQWR